MAGGLEAWIIGFYDDAHAVLPDKIRGIPVLGDIDMLKSILSVEAVQVVVAITDNSTRLRIAKSMRDIGVRFFTAMHPTAYVSGQANVGDGSVLSAGAVVGPDATVGSHCYIGPQAAVDRDAVVEAGVWVSAGVIVGPGARIGVRSVLGQNSSVERRAVVKGDTHVAALRSVDRA